MFDGVALVQLLQSAAVEFGEIARQGPRAISRGRSGGRIQSCLCPARARSAFNDRTIIVAETRDSKPLAAAEGRWRVVVPDEKRHGRWVRQVVSLNVRRA